MLRTVPRPAPAWIAALLIAAASLGASAQVGYVVPEKPFAKRVEGGEVGAPKAGGAVRVPYITWGGDVVTLFANGGVKTGAGSVFANHGATLELVQQDDFVAQVKDYQAGKSPYLRGTLGMIHCASEALARTPGAKPVVILQLTWSTGGDCLVVRPGISQVKDLKGKTVVLQQYSPHLDYLDVLLRDAGLSWSDIQAKFVPEITLPKSDTGGQAVDPANAFRKDPNVAAAFVISPDAVALTSGGTVGTGAEDSVKGARILVSTKTGSRIISDVYAVRSDYLQANRAQVSKFVLGWLQGAEKLAELRRDAQKNDAALKGLYTMAAESIFGSPQATADIQGLLADCTIAGYTGNLDFFKAEGNLQNFARTSTRIQSFLVREAYLTAQQSVAAADWDYDADFRPHLKDVILAEKATFGDASTAQKIVDKKTDATVLFEFQINFQPNQEEFEESRYEQDFQRVLDLASRYGGAVIEVVGHADPNRVRKLEKEGAVPAVIEQTKQSARNLSLKRANKVRGSLIDYGKKRNLDLDVTQFVTNGQGVEHPMHERPQSEKEWLANMRVVFRILNVEAEMAEFEKF